MRLAIRSSPMIVVPVRPYLPHRHHDLTEPGR